MKHIAQKYFGIPRTIIYLMMVDVFIQLINSAFTLLLNYEMLEHGFKDFQITAMVGDRYLTILLCSLPLALIIKGKKLKPFIVAGAISSPAVALLLIWAIHSHNAELIRTLMAVWGVTFSLVQILVMPYILLNGSKEHETESIALFFSAGNLTTIVTGLLGFVLPRLSHFFSTETLLVIYSAMGFAGVYFARLLPEEENLGSKVPLANMHTDYDWNLILQAAIPTFIIAFGAGFTIPFINLFFKSVHGMNAADFSLMNSVAFALVVIAAFLIPEVKRRFGYQVAITLVQSFSIIALFIMGTTEWYKELPIAVPVAVIAFIFRQPLMNMAGPMTSELTLNFVGEKNREMISAINAAIWSGCWFASAKIFSVLREEEVAYSNIIFITVALYIIGVAWYYGLIKVHEKKLPSMVKIGLMSDTHSYLDPKIMEVFKDVDEIWHAGDIGSIELCDELKKFKPFYAVYGNIDDKNIRIEYPLNLELEREGLKILITHIGGYPGNYEPKARKKIEEVMPDIFICGHSHILKVMRDEKYNKMLAINPGAAGVHGFHKVKTVLRFTLNNKKIENMEVVELGKRGEIS